MKLPLNTVVRNVLAIWGAVCAVIVAAAAVFAVYSLSANKLRHDRATKSDVHFVLNWPELGDERIEKVVHSFESGTHFSGDHFNAYAIRVTYLSESELSPERRWVRGDRLDDLMKEAVQFVTEAGDRAPWFPTAEDLLSDKYYVWRWRVEVMDRVSAATLIFARPADRMIFYASLEV